MTQCWRIMKNFLPWPRNCQARKNFLYDFLICMSMGYHTECQSKYLIYTYQAKNIFKLIIFYNGSILFYIGNIPFINPHLLNQSTILVCGLRNIIGKFTICKSHSSTAAFFSTMLPIYTNHINWIKRDIYNRINFHELDIVSQLAIGMLLQRSLSS